MSKKAKAPSSPMLRSAFVDVANLKECLRMLEAGCDYLDSLITDENINDDENPIPQAVCNYRNSALARFAEIREFLDSDPVVINSKHPAIANIYEAVSRIAEEAQRRHFDSVMPKAAPNPQKVKSPLLLVPTLPVEAPAN